MEGPCWSSLREFLASEAMHFLRVPTTRALSLVVSDRNDEAPVVLGRARRRRARSEHKRGRPSVGQVPATSPEAAHQTIDEAGRR